MIVLSLIASTFRGSGCSIPDFKNVSTFVTDTLTDLVPKGDSEKEIKVSERETELLERPVEEVVEEIVWEDFVETLRSQLFVAAVSYYSYGGRDGSISVEFDSCSDRVVVGSKTCIVKLDWVLEGDEDIEQLSTIVKSKIREIDACVTGKFPKFRVYREYNCPKISDTSD